MTCATAAVPGPDRRGSLLRRLASVARDAARAVADRFMGMRASGPDAGPAFAAALAAARLLGAATRLLGLAARIEDGRGLPRPRPPRPAAPAAPPGDAGFRPAAARASGFRVPFAGLLDLAVPGAEALRDRFAALLAEPEIAALVAAEPAARRAAAPIARALGLRIAPPPAAPAVTAAPVASAAPVAPEPAAQPAPAAASPGAAEGRPARRRWLHDRRMRTQRRPGAG